MKKNSEIWMLSLILLFLGANFLSTNRNHSTGLVNQTNIKAMVCYGQHTSKPVGEREVGYVEKCNRLAEQSTGKAVERYSK